MLAFDAPAGCGRIVRAEIRPGPVLAIGWKDGSSDLADLICSNRHYGQEVKLLTARADTDWPVSR